MHFKNNVRNIQGLSGLRIFLFEYFLVRLYDVDIKFTGLFFMMIKYVIKSNR